VFSSCRDQTELDGQPNPVAVQGISERGLDPTVVVGGNDVLEAERAAHIARLSERDERVLLFLDDANGRCHFGGFRRYQT
jgi:hypothetical protein